jgi:hypothetical protein
MTCPHCGLKVARIAIGKRKQEGEGELKTWSELKQEGSEHYKSGDVEPIDLYKAGEMFQDFALASIIKYAFRSRTEQAIDATTYRRNLTKIVHYAELLMAELEEIEGNTAINVRTLDGE